MHTADRPAPAVCINCFRSDPTRAHSRSPSVSARTRPVNIFRPTKHPRPCYIAVKRPGSRAAAYPAGAPRTGPAAGHVRGRVNLPVRPRARAPPGGESFPRDRGLGNPSDFRDYYGPVFRSWLNGRTRMEEGVRGSEHLRTRIRVNELKNMFFFCL